MPLRSDRVSEMTRNASVVLYILALTGTIVSVDFLFFRHHFWLRLIANIGIVMVFGAFYLRFAKSL